MSAASLQDMNKPDIRLLRQTLGRFVTGVTVVATRDDEGNMVGLTVNSFTPLSPQSGLLLWSLANKSRSLLAFTKSAEFVVNVLADDQLGVSRQMSAPVENRFAGVEWQAGEVSGLPIIDGCAAWFECRKVTQYQGGDHQIFVGKVTNCHFADKRPLLYFAGNYAYPAAPVVPAQAGTQRLVADDAGSPPARGRQP